MFLKLTEDDGQVLVHFGEGGVIKAKQYADDGSVELYNAEGNVIAKVKEGLTEIQSLALTSSNQVLR